MVHTEETLARLTAIPELTVLTHAPLSRYTRFALGGPADVYAETASVEAFIAALTVARAESVRGQAVTPFVLSYLHRESGGRTLRANKDLIAQNARLAGEIATA